MFIQKTYTTQAIGYKMLMLPSYMQSVKAKVWPQPAAGHKLQDKSSKGRSEWWVLSQTNQLLLPVLIHLIKCIMDLIIKCIYINM